MGRIYHSVPRWEIKGVGRTISYKFEETRVSHQRQHDKEEMEYMAGKVQSTH